MNQKMNYINLSELKKHNIYITIKWYETIEIMIFGWWRSFLDLLTSSQAALLALITWLKRGARHVWFGKFWNEMAGLSTACRTYLGPQLKTPTVFTCTQIFIITHFIYFFLPYLHQMLYLALFRTAIFYGVLKIRCK